MDKENLSREYQDWIEIEKQESLQAFENYKTQQSELIVRKRKTNLLQMPVFVRMAAAVLIIAMGTTIWLKRDSIFKPRFTEEQIALSYEHAKKALSVYSKSLSKEFDKLQNLKIDNQDIP